MKFIRSYLTLLLFFAAAISCEAQVTPSDIAAAVLVRNNKVPTDIVDENKDDIVFRLDTWNLSTMYQEQLVGSGVQVTPVTADGQQVGYIQDTGKMALWASSSAGGGTDRPLLGSDGTRNSFVTFDNTNDVYTVPLSTNYWRPFHAASPTFSIAWWMRMQGSDAATEEIFTTNNAGNTATIGIYIRHSTGNKIVCEGVYGSGGNTVFTVTSTGNVNVAAGWVSCILNLGSGTGGNTLYIYDATGTLISSNAVTVSGNGTTSANVAGLRIANAGNMSIADLIIRNRIMTPSEITAFTTYNPTRSSTNWRSKQHHYEFHNSSFVYSDLSSTPAVNNDPVREVRNIITSPFGVHLRNITSASSITSPTFLTNFQNGYSVVQWTGADGFDMTFQANGSGLGLVNENGGNYVLFFVVRNTDATNGSHFATGNRYIVGTAQGYKGRNAYFTFHAIDGSSGLIVNSRKQNNGFKAFAYSREGSNIKMYNSSDIGTGTNSIQFNLTTIGDAYSAIGSLWNMEGEYIELIKYMGKISESDIQQKLLFLEYKYQL